MIYLVVWPRGDKYAYSNETQARASMLNGDKLYEIDLVKNNIKVLI